METDIKNLKRILTFTKRVVCRILNWIPTDKVNNVDDCGGGDDNNDDDGDDDYGGDGGGDGGDADDLLHLC